VLTAASALGLSTLPAWAQFRIEISGVGATRYPLAGSSFSGGAEGAQVLSIVLADLARSGLFLTSEGPGGHDEASAVPAEALRAAKADFWLSGSTQRLADGRIDIRFRLWDVVRGQALLTRSLPVLAADLRLAAHRIADLVFERITGEPGVFATRIAYVLKAGRRYTLNVTDADGEAAQVALTSGEPIISPAWAPSGKALAYVSFESQKAVVWVQDLASGSRRVLANFPGSNSAPAWSPDGLTLALTLSRGGPAQLHLMARDGGGTPQRIAASAAIDTEPVWSPDGRFLYFTSDRGGGPQIYRVGLGGADAARVERITFQGGYNISPAVSPDGKRLAYVARQGNAFRVMLLDLDGGGTPQPVGDTEDDESPSFAPNGRLLLYATRSQGRDVLMTSTLDGRVRTRLLSSGADMREPAWGPFGR
jgi:TolB protein